MSNRLTKIINHKNIIPTGLLIAFIYMLFVILISFLLAFPGIGVLISPQPFIEVKFGRWTAAYYQFNSKGILWGLYIITLHLVYYTSILKLSNKFSNSKACIGGVLFNIVNLTLILFLKFTDMRYLIVLDNYALDPYYALLYWLSSTLVSITLETFSYRVAVRILSS